MAGDNYRVPFKDISHLNLPGHPGIHVNKSFIEDPNGWIQLSNSLQLQSGAHPTMYNNTYPNSGYTNAYPAYQQNYTAGYNYQGYSNQYSVPNQPAPPGDGYQQNSGWHGVDYSGQAKPEQKQDAVAQEMLQQKAQLTKQREDYVKKASVLRHELQQLRNQKQELMSDGSSDRDLALILKENDKLQEEILGKMKAIYNVIEMLSSIIKDGKSLNELEAETNSHACQSPEPPESVREEKKPSPPDEEELSRSSKKYCYVFYDTGLHWCRSCDEFPETAKELLQHLQSNSHKETAKENEIDTTPWHKVPMEPILPTYEDAPKKRIPIKGLQFFIPAPAWYCKLCDVWIGDLHCASHHLKSQAHFQNYENFVQQNPHWEMEWLKDREKAMARNGDSDDANKKKRQKRKSLERLLSKKKKKKTSKKRRKQSSDSSSSSSDSSSSSEEEKEDKSKSIRVAMRNMSKVQHIMNEDMTKWNVLEKILEEHRKKEAADKKEAEKKEVVKEKEDELINQWMTVSEPIGKEKSMIESLKDRMRVKQEVEKQKFLEMERKRKEKEREEQEALERQQRQALEEQERLEREKKRLEQEEFQRLTDKERSQVRFRTARENYRKRRSNSRSDNEEDRYREREGSSPSRSNRHRKESEKSTRSRDRTPTESRKSEEKKKPPGPPSYKKLPFIGRMPLFKNKKTDEKPVERKEIKKEEYEPQRRTRFEPGNLPRAFIPQPEVVRFPQLSSIPPLAAPPPPPAVSKIPSPPPRAPEPPKITPPKAPPAPQIKEEEKKQESMTIDEENLYSETGPEMDPQMMGQYYQDYSNMMYSQGYDFQQGGANGVEVPLAHTMPLEPPPLPPDDDLAMLGICADDMAAQSF